MDKPKLLTEAQLAEIRAGVRDGIRGQSCSSGSRCYSRTTTSSCGSSGSGRRAERN